MADKSSLENKLEELKEEYSKTKYNKATNKHLGILRKKISETKKNIIEAGKGQKGKGFFVKKSGDATVALMGFPSTGKSSLINSITNLKSKTAVYEFTTTTVMAGTMLYNDAHIQIFDMPGIIENAHMGAGGGRSVVAAMKVADLIVFVIDVANVGHLDILLRELKALNVIINKPRPRVYVKESPSNIGIVVEINRSKINDNEIQVILTSFGIHNARLRIEDQITAEELISIIANKNYYMKAIVALNKIDTSKDYQQKAKEISEKYDIQVVPISATEKINIEKLKETLYSNLGLITIYLKPKEEERPKPLILKSDSTIADAATKVHTELVDDLKCAYISGPSAKFNRQRVGALHILKSGDTITFIKHR